MQTASTPATAATIEPVTRGYSAARAALDKVALGLLDEHARHCVMGAGEDQHADETEELMAAVARLMRRG